MVVPSRKGFGIAGRASRRFFPHLLARVRISHGGNVPNTRIPGRRTAGDRDAACGEKIRRPDGRNGSPTGKERRRKRIGDSRLLAGADPENSLR